MLVVAIVLLDVAIQGHGIIMQTRMFQVDPSAPSRINTVYVTNNFVWGRRIRRRDVPLVPRRLRPHLVPAEPVPAVGNLRPWSVGFYPQK